MKENELEERSTEEILTFVNARIYRMCANTRPDKLDFPLFEEKTNAWQLLCLLATVHMEDPEKTRHLL